ncbi:MAG: cell division protein ZapA [Bacteroidales bacterium]|nr:cell division protein ZapA [Bacteroidales bacterium]
MELGITVKVLDREYKLTIKREDEEVVRKALKLIETRIEDYAKRYAFKDKQDLLSMVVLQYVINSIKLGNKQEYLDNHINQKLNDIDSILDEHLMINKDVLLQKI